MAGNREQSTRVRERSVGTAHLSTPDLNWLWSRALLGALSAHGVGHVVVSSGARCAPLVLAASSINSITIHTHPDERAAAFRALGIAKRLREPVALICTSGTAGANYYPAVIEARMSHLPLVILTADRPPELRGSGAPQTIDQINLYGGRVLEFQDLPSPSADADPEQWAAVVTKTLERALSDPVGPVHLNVPFREPLVPAPDRAAEPLDQNPSGRATKPRHSGKIWREIDWKELAVGISQSNKGLILCGPDAGEADFRDAVAVLSKTTRFPVLADPISGARFGMRSMIPVISQYDLLLANSEFEKAARPELVIRFGGLPTSKRLNEWLAGIDGCRHIFIDVHSEIADPYRIADEMIVTSPAVACRGLCAMWPGHASDTGYSSLWHSAQRILEERLTTLLPGGNAIFEGDVAARLLAIAPTNSTVFLSSSMPIRLVDWYAVARPEFVRVMANRGANGIDGVVSTAIGVSSVAEEPVILLIGDIAFLHDANALLGVARKSLNLKVVLLNNDGGGIFSFLPFAEHSTVFEDLVAMPQDIDFSMMAASHGLRYSSMGRSDEIESVLTNSLASSGPEVIEVKTTRSHTLEVTRRIQKSVAEERFIH